VLLGLNSNGVGGLRIHDHACLIYESEDEWRNTVIPYITLGLKRGERCVYGLNHRTRQMILDALKDDGIDADSFEETGQLIIADIGFLPHENESKRLDQVFAFYVSFIEKAVADGYPAVRFTGESIYTRLGCEPWNNLVEVNSRMNSQLFPHYPCMAFKRWPGWTSLIQSERWRRASGMK